MGIGTKACDSQYFQNQNDRSLSYTYAKFTGDQLSLRAAETSAVVATEPVALIRMMSNLVSNAVKYTDDGGVLLGVRRRGRHFAIEVYDTGAGLTRDEIDLIRQSYSRGGTSDGIEGEGIGLASVDAMAGENQLTLSIRSRPGSGSCFAIEGLIPITADPLGDHE
jgi:signal transduction histidine kinase